MSDDFKVQVHKVVLLVVDHEELGADGVREELEHARYPNHCMGPAVMHVETREVEWSDKHPLNGAGKAEAFERLFGQPDAILAAGRERIAEIEAEVARLRARLHKALGLEPRAPGCQCDLEIGDSDCPVHPTCETCEVAGHAEVGVCLECGSTLPPWSPGA